MGPPPGKSYGHGTMADLFSWGLEEQTPEHGKELPTTLKSEEELAKLTIDEHLSEVERTVLFLNGGQIIQQRHAIANLPHVLKGKARQAWEAIQGPLKAALNRLDTDCQIEAAEVFAYIAKERLMSPADLQACLLPTVVRNINKERSEEETEAWMKALFELIPQLGKEVLKSEVMPLALSKGDVEGNVGSRVICARILGALAQQLSREEVERGFFAKAMAMCQDVDYLVRRCMCEQLGAIGRAAGKELLLKSMLDELFELLKDEEVPVRCSALGALMSLLDMVPVDVRKARVLPILRQHMQPFDMDIAVQRTIARAFGQMLYVVKGELEGDDVQLFYGCFKHLASKSDVELRRACGAAFSEVLRAAAALHPAAFVQHFADTFTSLAGDLDEEVRLSIATSLHEVARWAGREHCRALLTRPLVKLLRDERPTVQAAVLPHLNVTLGYMVGNEGEGQGPGSNHGGAAGGGGGANAGKGGKSERDSQMDEIVRALVDLEAGAQRNWRLQAQLASSFPGFHTVFSSDAIYEHFLPLAYRFLSNSAAAVRPLAAEGVVCFLRYNRKERQRADIFLRLIREYARGKSYTQRLAFAEVCRHIVRRFSARVIKEWVFDLCLELLYDAVPNVRLQITAVLPSLKAAIKLPEDVDLLERLNNAISNSMSDNDRDVSATARTVNDTYKRTPVRMGGGCGIGGDSGAAAAYEAEERRKEDEERDCEWGFSPEDAKEIKAEIVQLHMKKRAAGNVPGVGPDARSAVNRRTGAAEPGARTGPGAGPQGNVITTRTSAGAMAANGRSGVGGAESAVDRRAGLMGGGIRSAGPVPSSNSGPLIATRVSALSAGSGARKSEPGMPTSKLGPSGPGSGGAAPSRPNVSLSRTGAASSSVPTPSSSTPKLPVIARQAATGSSAAVVGSARPPVVPGVSKPGGVAGKPPLASASTALKKK